MAVCPFADQSRRYDRSFPGSYVHGAVPRGILHSTETTGLPSYKGGSVAPHFTVDPRTGRIYQHFDTSRPSRALQHIGSVQTNNQGARQIEIIAYSDATACAKAKGLRVDQLTPAQLAPVTKLMRWLEETDGIHNTSGLVFKSYPSSAGYSNGTRLSSSSWASFRGWAGHSHVPQNNHGDPSDIAITALLAQTTGGGMTVRQGSYSYVGDQLVISQWSGALRVGTVDGAAAYSIAGGPGFATGTVPVYFDGARLRVRAFVINAAGTPVASCGSQDFEGIPGQTTCANYSLGYPLAAGQRVRIEACALVEVLTTIKVLGAQVATIEGS